MKKEITYTSKGSRADLGPLSIQRMLPNQYSDKVGPFVFLDYVLPIIKETITKNDIGAHPHRGIATLTYVFEGEVEHFDSAGNTGTIHSGGMQWMKAGNGVIHDENANYDSKTDSKYIHGFQFWLNLPAKNKAEFPKHIAIQAEEVPVKILADDCGWLKILVGNYEALNSIIPNYGKQFLYHLHLKAGKNFSLNTDGKTEVALFLPTQNAFVNSKEFQKGEFLGFDKNEGEIEIENTIETDIDIMLFGGEEYTEAIVAEGPFIMNTKEEIAEAYSDFYAGKYGQINLKKQ